MRGDRSASGRAESKASENYARGATVSARAEYTPSRKAAGRTFLVARGLKSRARAGGRERDAEGRPAPRRALDADVARVLLHDAVRDREAEPRAAPHALRREE